MTAMPRRKTIRKAKSTVTRQARAAGKVGKARLTKANRILHKAAADYAKLAEQAGVAVKKAASKLNKSRTAKALAAAALAIAGYAAVRAARRR